MSSKIEELSEALDKINTGHNVQASDSEMAELLEVATLLKKSGLTVKPPDHIRTATVQRASEGLTAHRKSRLSAWMYSGILSAAAALLIFVGIHGFPSLQEMSPILTPAPQRETSSLPAAIPADIPPSKPVAPMKEAKKSDTDSITAAAKSPPPATVESSAKPAPQQPLSTPRQASPAAPPLPRQTPEVSYKAKAALSSVLVVRLPGRTPESVLTDSAAGTIRQVFDAGTPRELIITQRSNKSRMQTDSSAKSVTLLEAGNEKSEARSSFNKVVIVINGQEVTLEGRQTIQELTELSKTLSSGTL
jgi:hypothetical protein